MSAIYKRELGSYFKSFFGWLFSVLLLLVGGFSTYILNFTFGYAQFEYTLYYIGLALAITIPILTMRVMSEERHQKTDQLLLSLPTPMTRVVLGKYLAMVTVLAIPLAIMAFYPLIMSMYGTVSLTSAYSTLLAHFLLGCGLIAVGQFISSLTESQIGALVLSLFINLLNFFLVSLASIVNDTAVASFSALIFVSLIFAGIVWLLTRNGFASGMIAVVLAGGLAVTYAVKSSLFEGLFATVMSALSIFSRLQNFYNNLFDVTSIVYFLAVVFIFLFLTVQSMEKRRYV